MKAIRIHEYGGLEVLKLEEIPRPEPKDDELLIRVHAAGVNPADAKIREGGAFASIYEDPFPFTLGWDISGVIEAIGSKVKDFKAGDAVYGMVNFPYEGGAYADFVTAPAVHLARKPEKLDHIHAAALPLAVLTAWQALFGAAKMTAGDRVLIHAAAGGVGHLAVQLARWKGASYIIATASASDEEYLKEIGVDEVIDYRTENFEAVVTDVDVVLDSIGGAVQENSYKVLKKGGFLVTIMEPPSEDRAAEYDVRAERIFVKPDAGELKEVAKLADQGLLLPHIFKVFPLEKAREAHELIEKGQTRGKVVLSVVD